MGFELNLFYSVLSDFTPMPSLGVNCTVIPVDVKNQPVCNTLIPNKFHEQPQLRSPTENVPSRDLLLVWDQKGMNGGVPSER